MIFQRKPGAACGGMQTSRDPMLRAKACGALMKKLLTFSPLKAAAIVTLLVTVLAGIVITDGVYASCFFYLNWSRLQGAADVAAHAGVKFLPRHRVRPLRAAAANAELNGVGRGDT